ncbi:hypothetical protein [Methylomarinum vadi]|nr:hypothetical protein [Methylomarinum vadi]
MKNNDNNFSINAKVEVATWLMGRGNCKETDYGLAEVKEVF